MSRSLRLFALGVKPSLDDEGVIVAASAEDVTGKLQGTDVYDHVRPVRNPGRKSDAST